MMKHSFAINVGAAIVLLVPAVALRGDDAKSLDESLRATVAAIDELAGVEKRLAPKDRGNPGAPADPSALKDLLRLTETPSGTDVERDLRRDELRDQLSALQAKFDGLQNPGATPTARPTPTHVDDDPHRVADTRRETAPSKRDKPAARDTQARHTPAAFETHGYVADTARLVRAYYKQERFNEALAVIGDAAADPSSNYWKGRCFEKLGKRDEALAAYRAASESKEGGPDAERAKEAASFLEWQTKFEARRTEVAKP
ncbi:MAG: hypothetical protein HZA52_07470 [Planctomycetes bacterium]|nr:hypothetical protein [Planctomycetota bacterium]